MRAETRQAWPNLRAVILIFAALLFSSQLALAQFAQQGPKLVGSNVVGTAAQGFSVALSADGITAIVGGPGDNQVDGNVPPGAAWVYTRSNGVWTQQGGKLVANDAVSNASQGSSVALSADGNTAIVGGPDDNTSTGAAWVYTRSGGVWTQQGPKLVGTGSVDHAFQGSSAALSADGNTAIVGGPGDDATTGTGAVWVFTRSNGAWSQQGNKLVGTGAVGAAVQGHSVTLSADGNTAIVGGPGDGATTGTGAIWVYTRSGGVWTQQGGKLVGTGAVGTANQGRSVALSSDGNTGIVGGNSDNSGIGAVWVYTRSGGVWTQQGGKLVGTGAVGTANQGRSVALSADRNTAIVGGYTDNFQIGAAWVFVQSAGALVVSPTTNIVASGTQGGAFSPASFQYQLTSTFGSVHYQITGLPTWLNANFTSGTATTTPTNVTFSLLNPSSLSPGTYPATITFTNTSNGQGNTTRTATLTVNARSSSSSISVSSHSSSSSQQQRSSSKQQPITSSRSNSTSISSGGSGNSNSGSSSTSTSSR
jgi:hypothetical protein